MAFVVVVAVVVVAAAVAVAAGRYCWPKQQYYYWAEHAAGVKETEIELVLLAGCQPASGAVARKPTGAGDSRLLSRHR